MKKNSRSTRFLQPLKENVSFLMVILSTLLALVLIVSLTFGSFYETARENAVTIGNMTVAQEADRIAESMHSGMNTLVVSSHTVDAMLRRGADAKQIETYLVQETQGIISGIDPEFSGIYGVINDVYVDGIGWKPEEGYDPYARPWYQAAAQKQGELAIVSPYVDAQTGSVMISFSKILSDGKNALSLDTNLHDIYAATEAVQLNGKGYCFLIDGHGQVVAHRDHDEVGKNYLTDPGMEGTALQTLIRSVYGAPQEEAVTNAKLDGRDCMVFSRSVQDEWFIVLAVDRADLFAEIRTSLVRNCILSLAVFVLVGYFCASNYLNRKKALRYAEHIRTDDLTGLNNRGEFDRYLHTTVSGMTSEKKLYLLLFDADDFKGVNDRYGHSEGDRALCCFARALREVCAGTDDFCARYGGDEFVIISKCDGEAAVQTIIRRVAQTLDAAAAANRLPYRLSLSCGYACYDPAKQSLTQLIDEADQNLYREKARKKANRQP